MKISASTIALTSIVFAYAAVASPVPVGLSSYRFLKPCLGCENDTFSTGSRSPSSMITTPTAVSILSVSGNTPGQNCIDCVQKTKTKTDVVEDEKHNFPAAFPPYPSTTPTLPAISNADCVGCGQDHMTTIATAASLAS
ncbi:hypothetical protein DFH11DRAFT_1545570 [Phellopilus nigrolimitatus]|nr:hypothetical protein DFH11DRAFT_1545570 [Phellopilus nigrolimitatus]